eukprot:jgi/Tetstr1/438485/TSEL_027040.t1
MTFDLGLVTDTSVEQTALDGKVHRRYVQLREQLACEQAGESGQHPLALARDKHAAYLRGALGRLPRGFVSLDASRPWICYWALHGLALLEAPLSSGEGGGGPAEPDIVAFLASCQHPTGGFGGGPGQLPHLAPTYAAVAALLTIGSPEALAAVDRPAMLDFLRRMCVPSEAGGGFTVHEGGEVDVRGCFTALATAHMLGLDVQELGRLSSTPEYVQACQTYEGGLAGEPGNEAHGGYAFCGVAALALLGRLDALDVGRLLRWSASCQGGMEGGFMGRTNKLVDGCYSWWQGGVFPIMQSHLTSLLLAGSDGAMAAYLDAWAKPAEELAEAGSAVADGISVSALSPVEHASNISRLLRDRAEALLQQSEDAEKAAQAEGDVIAIDAQDSAADLMLAAQQAVQVSKAAEELAVQLKSSAATLFPVERRGGDSSTSAPSTACLPPLFHADGLQLPRAPALLGPPANRLAPLDPLVNVVAEKLAHARAVFGAAP